MDFNTEVLKYKDDFLKDLNTLVSYESVRDESTKAENAPFGKNCRDVLDAMLDMDRPISSCSSRCWMKHRSDTIHLHPRLI